MRRKGEQPVVRGVDHWTPSHTVAHMIRTGSPWFSAWRMHKGYPFARLVRASGVAYDRIFALDLGAPITREEIDTFAGLWAISAEDLIASMPDPSLLAD